MKRKEKIKVLKALFTEVELANYNCEYGLGIRSETPEDKGVRSKSIRAFLVDLLKTDEDAETRDLMHLLEKAIDKNVYGDGE